MGQRGNVENVGNLDAGSVDCADCALTFVAGAFDIGFHLAQAKVIGDLRAVLCGHLCGIGSVLLRTAETHLAGA